MNVLFTALVSVAFTAFFIWSNHRRLRQERDEEIFRLLESVKRDLCNRDSISSSSVPSVSSVVKP